jgi:hypothetical protein
MKHFIFFITTLSFMVSLQAWTTSHKRFLKELDKLVPFIENNFTKAQKDLLQKTLYNFPDKQIRISPEYIGSTAVEYLQGHGIINSLTLHNPEALPHMFYLLVESLNDRRYSQAAFWVACISHSLNDSTSPHYTPSIYSFDLMRRELHLETNDGQLISGMTTAGLYVDNIYNRPEGRSMIRKLRSSYKFEPILGSKIPKILTNLSTLPLYLRNASFKHAERFMDNVQRTTFSKSEQTYNGDLAVAKMGIMGITATANVLNTAWELAKKKQRISPDDINSELISSSIDAILKKRQLKQMPLFKDVLPTSNIGKIGILAESYYRLNKSCLGVASKNLAAAIMGTLKKNGQSYRALNLNHIITKGFPDPQNMPILIIPATNISPSYRWLTKRALTNHIAKYTSKGGKILLIASHEVPQLGELSFNMSTTEESTTFSEESLTEGSLYAHSSFGLKGKTTEIEKNKYNLLSFKTIPSDKFRWLNINSKLTFVVDEIVKPLLIFKDQNQAKYVVAAYEQEKDKPGKAKFVGISSLFFFPNLYSSKISSLTKTQLDEVPETILNVAIKLLE